MVKPSNRLLLGFHSIIALSGPPIYPPWSHYKTYLCIIKSYYSTMRKLLRLSIDSITVSLFLKYLSTRSAYNFSLLPPSLSDLLSFQTSVS